MCYSLFQGLPNSVVVQYCSHVLLFVSGSTKQCCDPVLWPCVSLCFRVYQTVLWSSTVAMCYSLFQGLPNSVVIQYCGHVFLIAEVDSASQVPEPDETNNVKAASVFIPCDGGMYVTQPTCTHIHMGRVHSQPAASHTVSTQMWVSSADLCQYRVSRRHTLRST